MTSSLPSSSSLFLSTYHPTPIPREIFRLTCKNPFFRISLSTVHLKDIHNAFHRLVSAPGISPPHCAQSLCNGFSIIQGYHLLTLKSDIFKIIIAVLLPPLGVFLERGCGSDLLINILLTVLGYIPGIIHALFVLPLKFSSELVCSPCLQIHHSEVLNANNTDQPSTCWIRR
jgi:uncharacterized membrane protein YqaE (UPF0057 family)